MKLHKLHMLFIGFMVLVLHGCAIGQPEKKVKEDTVYITRTGTKYHASPCHYLKSPTTITLTDAVGRGYLPCSACMPPVQTETTGHDNVLHQPSKQPVVAPVQRTTQARQCMAYTKSGLRCKRTTTSSSGKCWQHE